MSKTVVAVDIRLLETDANRRGDVFSRLMGDLFFALGYEEPRFDIHKSGREVDISAKHRAEARKLVAECKATEEKIGGSDINKFIGVLDAERRKNEMQTEGYFVSLAGYTETAIEQELELGGKRVTLLGQQQVVDELIRGRIVVSLTVAMEAAGRLNSEGFALSDRVELLAHRLGWFWCVYFANDGVDAAFVLVHADGHSLSELIARDIVRSERGCGGFLRKLKCLNRIDRTSRTEKALLGAKKAYLAYLETEFGEVRLEGLPADEQAGSRRLKLESIFVPLHLEGVSTPSLAKDDQDSEHVEDSVRQEKSKRTSVGKVLDSHSRLVLLASPGSGKSTLLKRLATAYAFPRRRPLVKDGLPKRNWLPIVLRCRHVTFNASTSLLSIIHQLPPTKAEMKDGDAQAFRDLVNEDLRGGTILLLIDGLDEISDETQRLEFTLQLRTFLAIYPQIGVVITSREAGFRIVGRSLLSTCKHFRLSEFDDQDITQLTLAWHKEVIGPSDDVKRKAESLVRDILGSDRVRRLARNPLLLTTLLLVQRWLGQLPNRRAALYGKAIEVLLMTWNVEAHRPINPDEAIPQLAYVALEMMRDGTTQISEPRLKALLVKARAQLPEILGYGVASPDEFVRRVELRSSLLIQTGLVLENGSLVPVYEFQHLTFQEYLAALAIVEGYFADRNDTDTLLSLLGQHLDDEKWTEVVALAAVLAGRRSQEIIKRLTELCQVPVDARPKSTSGTRVSTPERLLGACLVDEVQIPPADLENAISVLSQSDDGAGYLPALTRGKFTQNCISVCNELFLKSSAATVLDTGKNLAFLGGVHPGRDPGFLIKQVRAKFASPLAATDILSVASAASYAVEWFYRPVLANRKLSALDMEFGQKVGDQLCEWADSEDMKVYVMAVWALAWLGRVGAWDVDRDPRILERLVYLWMKKNEPDTRHVCSWAMWTLPRQSKSELKNISRNSGIQRFIKEEYEKSAKDDYRNLRSKNRGCLVLSFYAKGPWVNGELLDLACAQEEKHGSEGTEFLETFLPRLGSKGVVKLAQLKEQKKSAQGSTPSTPRVS